MLRQVGVRQLLCISKSQNEVEGNVSQRQQRDKQTLEGVKQDVRTGESVNQKAVGGGVRILT